MRPDDLEQLKDDLLQYRADLESATTRAELVEPCWPRLLATLELIPESARTGDVLELGATPFFLTLCLRRLCTGKITLANWFGTEEKRGTQRLTHARTGEQLPLEYDLFNIETELFPYPDHSFDIVIFSELIEHLGLNPVRTLAEIHRVLRPGGCMILTTPNSVSLERLENYLRAGNPMVDRYSPLFGYGARHNREYHPQQLRDLFDGNGFDIEELVVRDLRRHSVHEDMRRAWWRLLLAREATEVLREPRTFPDRVARLLLAWETLDDRGDWLSRLRRRYIGGYLDIVRQADETTPRGEHIFLRARRTEPFGWRFPPSLFDNIDFYVFIRHPWMEMGINDTIQCAGGWYPLERHAERYVRRIRGTAQGFLKGPDNPVTFGIELRAEVAAPLTAHVVVWDRWLGKIKPENVYLDTKVPIAVSGGQRLELALTGPRPEVDDEVEVRIAINRDARAPLPTDDPPEDERRVAVHRFWLAGEQAPVMAFKLYVREEIVEGLDETYQFETWADGASGTHYYDVHCSVIEARETCVPTLRRVLGGTRRRILESGCGTGRWMAYFERLGHDTVGIDDSAGPIRLAKSRDPHMRFVRGDAVSSPFRSDSFDVVFSSYVAEHFEDGPQPLLREIHRVLKPDGILLIVVPYNNLFRRCVTNRMLQAFYLVTRLRGRGVAFTEMHYSRAEMDGFLTATGFRVEHVEPDDFRFPWAKGLSLDLGRFVRPQGADQGTWELNPFGRMLARTLNALSPWLCAAGVLYVARADPSVAHP